MARKKKIGLGDKIFHCQIIGELKKKKKFGFGNEIFLCQTWTN